MMRGLVATLEQHHKVRILDEAVEAAVRLSHRYITGRQLPDKAVSVLDTACARVALGQARDAARASRTASASSCSSTPRSTFSSAKASPVAIITSGWRSWPQDKGGRRDPSGRAGGALGRRAAPRLARSARHPRPARSSTRLGRRQEQRDEARAGCSPEEVERLQAELDRLNAELAQVQGETPLMQVCVDGQTIAEVVSGWTGIPVGKMVKDEINTVLSLQELLEQRIIGQSHALEAISQRIRTARARLEDPRRPIGVFLLVGPSGVGKTETALALADTLYGGERNMVTINMSEYQEAHTVSGLKGSPPGYVGYGEGGVLTEAVRRRPYCVVLLDEMEKAHPDVMELFYQVFDKGVLEDAEGREIDFKNTVILLTSNVGTDTIMKLCADPETRPEPEALAEALRPDLLKVFKPAFLGRMVVVPYYPHRR